MEAFDAAYGESLRYVESTFVLAGCHGRIVKSLRSYVQIRRLSRWARFNREARTREGRRSVPARVHASVSRISGWLPWRRSASG